MFKRLKNMTYPLGIFICAAALVLAAGCSDEQKTAQPEQAAQTEPAQDAKESTVTEPKELQVNVYYPKNDGMGLVAVSRTIRTEKDDKYTAAMKSLLAGTKEKDQTNVIPKKAKLRSVSVKDGRFLKRTAAEFQRRLNGGGDARRLNRQYAHGISGGAKGAHPD